MLRVVIRPQAAADLNEIIDYYVLHASPDTAERFIAEFREALHLLSERPNIGSRRFAHLLKGGALRVWSLDRFPFRIFYTIAEENLDILAIDHERRNLSKKNLLRRQ